MIAPFALVCQLLCVVFFEVCDGNFCDGMVLLVVHCNKCMPTEPSQRYQECQPTESLHRVHNQRSSTHTHSTRAQSDQATRISAVLQNVADVEIAASPWHSGWLFARWNAMSIAWAQHRSMLLLVHTQVTQTFLVCCQ